MAELVQAPTITARRIAQTLGLPEPTVQQQAIIESPLASALVVAGAGSGKTETMSSRVVWLLVNHLAEPGDILGLTFTRKAAGELAARFRARIDALHRAGLIPDGDPFEGAAVATYNSFADSIYRDNALLLGREGDGVLLGEAAAWQLARRVVVACDDERLAALDKSVETIADAVLALSRSLSENIADGAAVAQMAREFAAVVDLPADSRGARRDVDAWAGTVGALGVLTDLARAYREEKRLRGFVEYSDQVALALRIVENAPEVRERLRSRHRVILLDEYQDTSVVQSALLATVFRGLPVMAVGDPNQAIYGWRGASAANLARFPEQFGADATYPLTVSWRNGRRILAAANAVAAPLAPAGRARVAALDPAPSADEEPVDAGYLQTLEEEADTVACWLAERLPAAAPDRTAVPGSTAAPDPAAGGTPTAALLVRARTHQQVFLAALARHGVPYHVLGVDGLLEQPAVADLVSGLRVVADVATDAAVVRLLAGARWRIGVRDLQALHRCAVWLAGHDAQGRPLDEQTRRRLRGSAAAGEGASLADAVDFAVTAPAGHAALTGLSAEGLRRVRAAGTLFAGLRARRGLGLRELVAAVRQELLIDVECLANETLPQTDAGLDAFADAVDDYLALDEDADVRGFLHWLADAARRDRLGPRPEEPEPGTVQVLTVHGAKGLEWDHVAVPMLTERDFPSTSQTGGTGWLHFGVLPYEFRGDGDDLPHLAWRAATTRKELVEAVRAFKDDVGARQEAEERRLAYVALTRARHRLLLTGSFWVAGTTTARRPSPFLADLAEAGIIPAPPAGPESAENPSDAAADTVLWPADPLGSRRDRVVQAARRVREARPGDAGPWQRDIDLLLAERRRRTQKADLVRVPYRVAASRFKDFVYEPARLAAQLRRPMPQKPFRATRLGTLFHTWVEERSGRSAPPAELDEWPSPAAELPDVRDAERLERLKSIFEASPWAHLRPLEVEREIHLPFEGHLVICKIDAVYARGDRREIVDWKTGALPDGPDLERRRLQLALYRIAYAQWAHRALATVDACFYFVAHDRVIRPPALSGPDELARLWHRVMGSPTRSPVPVTDPR